MIEFVRIFAPLAEPIAMIWSLMLLATVLFLRKKRLGCAVVQLVLAGLIYAIGGTPWPSLLLASLERPYVRDTLNDVPAHDAVVMLGGDHRPSRYDVFGVDLTAASDRIITAVELMRQRKGRALVLGGGGYLDHGQKQPDGPLLERWFTAWQLPVSPVFNLGVNANTHDEAVHFQALAKEHQWKRVLLVTSAFHMKRAEATFRQVGVDVVPVACDFRVSGVTGTDGGFHLFPLREGFEQLELYLHEKLSWWFYSWQGWLDGSDVKPGGGDQHPQAAGSTAAVSSAG
jgi:uncharacterized SAM-binding protein YcdF (DUF218 family)